jgi:Predicted transcriptional regulators containing the CopG/Arc/MetJ DNA-binding domain
MTYDKQVTVRMPPKDIQGIEQCIENGYAKNTSDFVTMAVRNEITRCKAEA